MIHDLLRGTPRADDVADVCVVGAGAAGICLAIELARLGKKVVLLEGGGREIEEAAQEPYQSELVGLQHRGIHTGRFRAQGGTTIKWGGQILELNKEDFAVRPWIANSGWPITKQELQPFYARAMQLEGVGGAIQEDDAVWRALRLQRPEFGELQSYLSRWCPEPNFATLHGEVLAMSENIAVWLHCNAVELLLEEGVVRGIRCRTQPGASEVREAEFCAREFVFCMGTIECVRFFLQPRVSGLPWNESGLLGKHFQDHIDADIAEVDVRRRKEFARDFDNIFLRGFKYHPKLRLAPETQKAQQTLNCAATMSFAGDGDNEVAGIKQTAKHMLRGKFSQVKSGDIARMLKHAPLLLRQTARFAAKHRMYNSASAKVRLRVHCEQQPDSASSITLSEERDSLDLFRTRLDWRVSELEQHSMRVFAQTAVNALAPMANVEVDAAMLGEDAARFVRCDDSNHHMGGMRMHSDAARGVVDTELRLHGTKNCFVCSGAVFPTSGFSNPTHTVLALAMRLSKHLARP